jgi:hypothetical protein
MGVGDWLKTNYFVLTFFCFFRLTVYDFATAYYDSSSLFRFFSWLFHFFFFFFFFWLRPLLR